MVTKKTTIEAKEQNEPVVTEQEEKEGVYTYRTYYSYSNYSYPSSNSYSKVWRS